MQTSKQVYPCEYGGCDRMEVERQGDAVVFESEDSEADVEIHLSFESARRLRDQLTEIIGDG